jgi:RNA recognition motif-containing protein
MFGGMREKQEREALPRASGAIRLTEYDPPRRGGFVNRLDKETTSFFFTNFPEEAHVVELWSLFAKHGRVGEVYVPNKRDKHGNRFGFVKFKEIKSIEALTARLEDVWMGTFRLRVNLSLFGRNKRRADSNQPLLDVGLTARGGKPLARETGERTIAEKSFKSAIFWMALTVTFRKVMALNIVNKISNGTRRRLIGQRATIKELRIKVMCQRDFQEGCYTFLVR